MKSGTGKNAPGRKVPAKDTKKTKAPKNAARQNASSKAAKLSSTKIPAPPGNELTFDSAAAKRMAQTRRKISDAMEDPTMRDQLVRAIRSMMQEKKS
jgi:hypothetical protein